MTNKATTNAYVLKPMSSALQAQLFTGPALRRAPSIFDAGSNGNLRHVRVSRTKFGLIRAVVNSDQNKSTAETATKSLNAKDVNGSLLVGSSTSKEEGLIDVKAVITIRKKMKEKLIEKVEDQWELFMNGIGQGMTMQLISEEIDPG